MANDIAKVSNISIFDGSKDLLGLAGEMTLPDITATVEEHQGVGQVVKIELPTGTLEKMEAKVKWNTFYPDIWIKGGDTMMIRKLQMFGNVNIHNSSGLVAQKQMKVALSARWKKTPGGVYGPAKSPEIEQELSVFYFKMSYDGKDMIEVDAFANVYKVDGKDVLETYRKNLGG